MIARGLLALALLTACTKKQTSLLDADLPEQGPTISIQPPVSILEEAASSLNPSDRGHALGFLVATSEHEAGGAWAERALFDPDGWVQRQGVIALIARSDEPLARQRLTAYIARSEADPYTRSYAAVRLAAHSDEALQATTREAWRAETEGWRRAPLALGALAHGDDEALETLATALARGEVALEVEFLLDVGRSGREPLIKALQTGEDWAEEELALAYAVARMQLGDPSGEQILRRAITGDNLGMRLEALDYLAELDHPAAEALLRKARGSGPEVARTHAELALAARGRIDAGVILTAGASRNAEIRSLAVRFAGIRLMDSALLPRKQVRALSALLEGAILDTDPDVRRSALIGVHTARLADREGLLEPALGDDSSSNRVQAAGAMLMAQSEP